MTTTKKATVFTNTYAIDPLRGHTNESEVIFLHEPRLQISYSVIDMFGNKEMFIHKLDKIDLGPWTVSLSLSVLKAEAKNVREIEVSEEFQQNCVAYYEAQLVVNELKDKLQEDYQKTIRIGRKLFEVIE